MREDDTARRLESSPETNGVTVRTAECFPSRDGSLRIGESRNVGAAVATADRLCFLDIDCIVADGAPERWIESIDAFHNALLAPRVRYLSEGWEALVRFAEPVGGRSWLAHSTPASRPEPIADRVATEDEFDLFWSVAFCCSAATFDRVGGFDTGFVGYGAEDTDFARRARRRRVPLVWLARGEVYHQFHPPTRWSRSVLRELVANANRFKARWGDWPMRGWLEELSNDGEIEWDANADVAYVSGIR
jgi:GT2 family glycosyltransferase